MSTVTASIHIPAPPERVWELVMDPGRLGEWVTIHHRLVRRDPGPPRPGFTMDQQLQVRGVRLEVRWQLVECRQSELAVWEGRGPARSRAHSEYRLRPEQGGTRFDYRNEFHAPLGVLGAIASRALARGMPERQARQTLEKLHDLMAGPSADDGTGNDTSGNSLGAT